MGTIIATTIGWGIEISESKLEELAAASGLSNLNWLEFAIPRHDGLTYAIPTYHDCAERGAVVFAEGTAEAYYGIGPHDFSGFDVIPTVVDRYALTNFAEDHGLDPDTAGNKIVVSVG